MNDAQQIAAGVFYTDAELRARPWLARTPAAAAGPRDPNSAPVTAAARAALAAPPLCRWCLEPGDERSQLGADDMHTECSAAWAAERNGRHTR